MQKTTAYEKIINKALKIGWNDTPIYDKSFNYDNLLTEINYSINKLVIGKTHKPKTWDDYHKILMEYKPFSTAVTLDKMIFVYGYEDGTEKFDEYRKKQALTNTFEYKNKRYGITEEQFKEYNKSRAVTLENLIKKYGKNEGEKRFKKYCDRQAYTNSLEYLGEEKYKKVNKSKSHSVKNYIERYGEELGKIKLVEFYEKIKSSKSYSKISQKLFKKVEELLTEREKEYTYYACKNKEYGLLCENKCFLYDFICTDLNLCIEYHGDHYHGNPLTYSPDDYLRGRGCTNIKAKEKWNYDEKKINWLKSQRGYDTIVIWDSEWRDNPDLIIKKLTNWINKRRKILKEV